VSDPNSSRACAFTAARSDQESGQNCLKVPEYPHYSHWLVLGPKWTKTGRSVSLPAGSPSAYLAASFGGQLHQTDGLFLRSFGCQPGSDHDKFVAPHAADVVVFATHA